MGTDPTSPELQPVAPSCRGCGRPLFGELRGALCPPCLLSGATLAMATPERSRLIPDIAHIQPSFPGLEILEFLGAGGMGSVYLARQTRLDRMVALKVLTSAPEFRAEFALRFEREARVLARLSHPNIVTVHDFGDVTLLETPGESLFFLIMEFVEGEDLARRLQRGALPETEARDIAAQVCDALAYAHGEGVTHRDIKPANLLLDRRGRVKVADFGLAKLMRGADTLAMDLTLTGATMGTPHYMAPEQWEPSGVIDHRADLYALGVVCDEMVSGRVKPERDSSLRRSSRASRRFELIVDRATQRDPARRFPSAGEMRAELARIGGDFPLITSHVAPRARIAWLWGGIVVLIFLLAAAMAIRIAGRLSAPASLPLLGGNTWSPERSRIAARSAVGLGAELEINYEGRLVTVSEVPPGDFKLLGISFQGAGDKNWARVTPADVNDFLSAGELRRLSLFHCRNAVNQAVCRRLGTMTNLEALDLQGTMIKDQWVASVARAPELQELRLDWSPVSNLGITTIQNAPKLRNLHVSNTAVNGGAVARLTFAPNLRVISLGNSNQTQFWDDDVKAIVNSCPFLEFLYIGGRITPQAFSHIVSSKFLQTVKFGDLSVSKQLLSALAEAPALSQLQFDPDTVVDEDAWDALPQFGHLKVIRLDKRHPHPALLAAAKQYRPPLRVIVEGNSSEATKPPAWDPAASRLAAEHALALGASVAWEQGGKIGSTPGEALPPGDFKVFKISFDSSDYRKAEAVEPQDLEAILGAREMEQLSLKGCKKALDERTCAMIGDLPRLTHLTLHLTNVRDGWVSSLATANLNFLSLDGTLVSDQGVRALADSIHLESLQVLGTLVGGRAVADLPFAAQLRRVGIGDRLNPRNWDEDVAAVLDACENLEVLLIHGNITPSAVERMAGSKHLTQIFIGEIPLQRAHFSALTLVPSLTILIFDKAALIPDEAWEEIPRMKELRVIAIRSGPAPPALKAALEKCNPRPKLEIAAEGVSN